MRLLTIVPTYNRPLYLENAVRSVRELLRFGDVLVVDDGSDDPAQHRLLDVLEEAGVRVSRRPRGDGRFHGNLYDCMNHGLEQALRGGYDFVNFVQDDMQWMRHDPALPELVEAMFETLPDAAQVSTVFYKRIVPGLRNRLELIEEARCYHVRPYGMADTGFVPLALVEREGFRFHGTEGTTSAFWRDRGHRLYAAHAPHLAWLPFPAILEQTLGPPPREYYLKPIDDSAAARLEARPLEDIPFHEQWCLPWGWSALQPFWFTAHGDEYPALLAESIRRGTAGIPRWIGSGRPRARVPSVAWVLRAAARRIAGRNRSRRSSGI